MKILIVYYTRTSTTRKVAETIQMELAHKGAQVDSERIVDMTSRTGGIGYLKGGRDVIFKRTTRIEPAKHNPADYDLIIMGTPVWVGTMAPAIKVYLSQFQQHMKEVAFFTTQGGTKRQRVFDDLKVAVKKEPVAELMLTTLEVRNKEFRQKLSEFVDKLIVKDVD